MVGLSGGNNPSEYNNEGELLVDPLSTVSTLVVQYTTAQTNAILLSPKDSEHHFEIHGVSINTKSVNTDVNIRTPIEQVAYLNVSSTSRGNSNDMHLDTTNGEDILIDCGAGTSVTINYHEEIDHD